MSIIRESLFSIVTSRLFSSVMTVQARASRDELYKEIPGLIYTGSSCSRPRML
jgi:hypothetical protein